MLDRFKERFERYRAGEQFIWGMWVVVAGIVGLGVQVFLFLRDDAWTPFSLIDGLKIMGSPETEPWIFKPGSWLGLHAVLDWISLPAFLIAWGLVMMATNPNSKKAL